MRLNVISERAAGSSHDKAGNVLETTFKKVSKTCLGGCALTMATTWDLSVFSRCFSPAKVQPHKKSAPKQAKTQKDALFPVRDSRRSLFHDTLPREVFCVSLHRVESFVIATPKAK